MGTCQKVNFPHCSQGRVRSEQQGGIGRVTSNSIKDSCVGDLSDELDALTGGFVEVDCPDCQRSRDGTGSEEVPICDDDSKDVRGDLGYPRDAGSVVGVGEAVDDVGCGVGDEGVDGV